MRRRNLIQKEILSERRKNLHFIESRTDHAAQQEKAALSRRSEVEYHTRLLLEGQKNPILSEARSELEYARIKGHFYSFTLNGWNSIRRISDLISPGEKNSPLSELEERERERKLFKRIV